MELFIICLLVNYFEYFLPLNFFDFFFLTVINRIFFYFIFSKKSYLNCKIWVIASEIYKFFSLIGIQIKYRKEECRQLWNFLDQSLKISTGFVDRQHNCFTLIDEWNYKSIKIICYGWEIQGVLDSKFFLFKSKCMKNDR